MADTADLPGHLPEAVDTVLLPERLLRAAVVATVRPRKAAVAELPLRVAAVVMVRHRKGEVVAMAHLPVVPHKAVAGVMARLPVVPHKVAAVVMARLPVVVPHKVAAVDMAEHLRLLAVMARLQRLVATARRKVGRWCQREWARWPARALRAR